MVVLLYSPDLKKEKKETCYWSYRTFQSGVSWLLPLVFFGFLYYYIYKDD